MSDYFEYTISQDFLPVLIYADYSGLDDSDIKDLDNWLESLDHPNGYWDIDCSDIESDFKRCEVTGLYSDCIIIRWVVV